MHKNKLIVVGLAAALCLIGMIGNASLHKLITGLFFGTLAVALAIPMMMVQGVLVLAMGTLLIGYAYWLGFAAWGVLLYWLKGRK